MLEYTKTVLQKVSFNEYLFKKELMKSLDWLETDDRIELQQWINIKFGSQYSHLISEIFDTVAA